MAQPATTPFEFSPSLRDPLGIDIASGRSLDGPANRSLSELALVLDANTPDPAKWGTGKSLGFIIGSCGLFWSMAAAIYFVLR